MTPTVDLIYTTVVTSVFVNWKPDTYSLRKLGLYTEGNLPITAEFSYEKVIPIGSYFVFTVNYPAGGETQSSDTDEFEIVNMSTNGFRETVVFPTYAIAPRRK
jgi:hypothetical protein